ncbi:MAG: phosphoenolpyruvate carboxylase [Chloroflexi bacterium]|nr:phosphoenolpyruvate carboxylase [Chloroflexota bacterium]
MRCWRFSRLSGVPARYFKPDIASERRNSVYYLRSVFPTVLPLLDERLRQAWRTAGDDPALIADASRLPRIRFGTRVGGDRDGHPLVTADVTRETFAELRLQALLLLRDQLQDLARFLSLSDQLQTPPAAFLEHIADTAVRPGPAGAAAVNRNPNEPWRQWLNLMIARLPLSPDDPDRCYRDPAESRPVAPRRVAGDDWRTAACRSGGAAGDPESTHVRFPSCGA